MFLFPPTLILRHRKENLKKCSLRGLETREDFLFVTYPLTHPLPDLSHYVLLTLDAPVLSVSDANLGIFLIDGTWRHAQTAFNQLPKPHPFICRSLPAFQTAYPRRQEDCPNPQQGLASVEALFLAYHLLRRNPDGLLDAYHWKEEFLKRNSEALKLKL